MEGLILGEKLETLLGERLGDIEGLKDGLKLVDRLGEIEGLRLGDMEALGD